MSRKFIPCLGLVLGAAMIAGTPALATGTVTESEAAGLVAALAWRGIGGYPRSDDR